jgi:hypothetical protein
MLAPPKPPQDELEALIKEARERRRRQLLGAAGVAIIAALGLGIYAIAGGLGQKGGSAGFPRASVPLCRSSQLKAVHIGFLTGPFDNRDIGGLEFTNTSSLPCSLPGGVPRVGPYFSGKKLRVSQLPADGSVPNSRGPAVHVLAPGGQAYAVFHWSNWCGPPRLSAASGAHSTLRYFFGDGLVLSERSVPVPGCATPNSPSIIRVAGPLASTS